MTKHNIYRAKLISIILVVLLAVTQAVPVFAEGEKTDYNYVSIGASNTNGYGLIEYLKDGAFSDAPGSLVFSDHLKIGYEVEGSYPVLVEAWLQEKMGDTYDVKLSQLAGSGMRSHELRMLLDDNYKGDRFTEFRFFSWKEDYNGDLWFGNSDTLAAKRELYKNSIKGANLITIDIGENDFTQYLAIALLKTNYLMDNENSSFSAEQDVNDLLGSFTPAEKAKFEKATKWVYDNVLPKIGNQKITDFLNGGKNNIADTIAYAYVSFCKNFDESLSIIRSLNKDAKIIVVGIQNPVTNLRVKVDNYTIPAGDILGSVIDLANVYLASGSAFAKEYTYTNCGSYGSVETVGSAFAKYEGDPTVFTEEKSSEDGDCTNANFRAFAAYTDALETSLLTGTRVVKWMYTNKKADSDNTTILGASSDQVRSISDLKDFFKRIDKTNETGVDLKIGEKSPRAIAKNGENEKIYNAGCLAAWNYIGWLAKIIFEDNSIDIGKSSEIDIKQLDFDKPIAAVSQKIDTVIDAACKAAIADGTDYEYYKSINEAYVRNSVKELSKLDMAILAYHFKIGCAFAVSLHPDNNGHKQLANAVEAAYEKTYTFKDLKSGIKSNLQTKKDNLVSAAKESVVDRTLGKISDKIISFLGDKIARLEEKAADSWIYNTIYQLIKTMITVG